jgi:hypothetical protein
MPSIRIVACPPGEAPELVRRAWIGLHLPLLSGKPGRLGINYASGVLSAPRIPWLWWLCARLGLYRLERGYTVEAVAALTLLEAADPTAAAWWREHCPHLYQAKRFLVFPAHVCEEVN